MAANETLSMRALFKFLLPLMGICMTSVLLFGNEQKAWAVFPAVLIALYLSAADIRLEGEHRYYRHFVSWGKLPDDVVDVRCSLLPALGYVRFRLSCRRLGFCSSSLREVPGDSFRFGEPHLCRACSPL
ncbi:hypothetical protein [Paludibaculum fermentans]|uniref:Uncharacterized protein n=1 Tax=Paludibaculum fermentans TaxID=1473598 RepID=A0A7S7NXA3_PALFE|nr:hypothetical protein [Paludibaculum fermentans]QOY91459.1 hypothetical protein IRI77_16370 [Paludibaculum fermentans]